MLVAEKNWVKVWNFAQNVVRKDSTGKYSEIARKIETIAKQERELLDNLPVFVDAQY